MKQHLIKLMVVAGACAIAATSYAVYAKVNAAPGYHILNANNSAFYVTRHPEGCTGITFPNALLPNSVDPNTSNAIAVDSTTAGTQICSTVYDTAVNHANRCIVTLNVVNGIVNSLAASPVNSGGFSNCSVTAGGADVLLTGSGS